MFAEASVCGAPTESLSLQQPEGLAQAGGCSFLTSSGGGEGPGEVGKRNVISGATEPPASCTWSCCTGTEQAPPQRGQAWPLDPKGHSLEGEALIETCYQGQPWPLLTDLSPRSTNSSGWHHAVGVSDCPRGLVHRCRDVICKLMNEMGFVMEQHEI